MIFGAFCILLISEANGWCCDDLYCNWKYTFKSAHGKYLSAQPDGTVRWDRDAIGPWEQFIWEDYWGKSYLKSCHGYYLSIAPSPLDVIEWNREHRGSWESLEIKSAGFDHVTIKRFDGDGGYLSAQDDGSVQLRDEFQSWEKFYFEKWCLD